jgi:acyl carrier protein
MAGKRKQKARASAPAGPAQIEAQVRAFLRESVPRLAEVIGRMDGRTRIFDVVDSLSLLELVTYIEKAFHITVKPLEFIPENFETLDRLVAFVDERASTR